MSLIEDEASEDVGEGSVRMVDIGAIVAFVTLEGLSSSVIIWFTRVAWPNPIVEKRGQGRWSMDPSVRIFLLYRFWFGCWAILLFSA